MTENNHTYKQRDGGGREILSMLIYRPVANFFLLTFVKNMKVTPNQISLFSLILMIVASWFFAFTQYPYILWGILFLHLGYVFDMLDGQYARYKGLSSKFGFWFDPFVDTIKAAFIFMALSYGAYVREGSPAVFIWGFIAMTQSFLAYYVLNTRGQIIKEKFFEVEIKKDIYLGYEVSLYWIISIFVILNSLYVGLIFLATAGAFGWIKPFLSLRKYYLTHKETIEKNTA